MVHRTLLPDFQLFFESGLFDIVEDYHGVHAEVYDNIRGCTKIEVEFYRSIINSECACIADLGCGTGSLAIPLAEFCKYFLAIDSSEDMLAVFRKKILDTALSERIKIRKGDFTDFPNKEEGLFDLIIISYNSLVHVTPSQQVDLFKALAASLKPMGHLVVDLWMPNLRMGKPYHRCSITQGISETWLMYSQEIFPSSTIRVVNMLMVPLNSSRRPVITSLSEHIFTRSEVRDLFRKSDLKVRCLPLNHPVVRGQKQRLIYIGTKS